MKNFNSIYVVIFIVSCTNISAQDLDPINPNGDPGQVPIDNNIIWLLLFAIILISYFVFKQKIRTK